MPDTVTLPLWLAALLVVLAAWAAVDRLLLPSARFVVRRRVNRVIDELNTRLAIRIQPFKLTARRVLIDRLTYDPAVLAAVEDTAGELRLPREVVVGRVRRYAKEIVPSFNAYLYFRVVYRVARAVARLLYRVRLGRSEEAAQLPVPPDATVVFVMNHRSNMDYVLVAYLAATATALSYAVGEWARVWPLQALIRALGAYFVRRRSGNPLYRKVLERYVHMATVEGVTQAVYLEGGLSRDGSLGTPKLGLLDYMLRGFDPKAHRDVVFVPVGLNYDRVLEDRTLLRELDPAAPRRGTGGAAATTLGFLGKSLWLALRNRWHRFGYACVSFGAPVSARDFVARCGVDLPALPCEERFAVTAALAEELMAAVGRVVPVVPVPLVATVLLDRLDRGAPPADRLELKVAVQRLAERLEAAGALVYVPRRDRDYAVEVGLRMLVLRRIVEEREGLLAPRAEERALLAYYARSIEHLPAAEPAAAEGPSAVHRPPSPALARRSGPAET